MARILVADDNAEYLSFFCEAVEQLGHSCDAVEDGNAVLDRMAKGKYDILFLDLIMPGRGAISTLHAVRELDQTVPIIIISGNTVVFESPIVTQGLQLAQAKMSKFTGLQKLGELIDRFVGQKSESST
ncbi:MAG: response regulator [Pseudomonadota bacterium]